MVSTIHVHPRATLASMRRARQTLQVVGTCAAAVGFMLLPFATTSPKALTQSLFEHVRTTGAFTAPGLVLLAVGLGCLVLAALLPSRRD